jgi:hypothetical protein
MSGLNTTKAAICICQHPVFRMLPVRRMIALPGNEELRGDVNPCLRVGCVPALADPGGPSLPGGGTAVAGALPRPLRISPQCSVLVALRDSMGGGCARRKHMLRVPGYDVIVSYSSGKETGFGAGRAGNNESGTVTSANGCCWMAGNRRVPAGGRRHRRHLTGVSLFAFQMRTVQKYGT